MSERITGFAPYFDGKSRVLILGSFPSVKSRQQSFYYGNGQNAFWGILAKFFGEDKPLSVEDKKAFLSAHNIALWDIVTECEIVGSQDASIKNYIVANLSEVLQNASVEYILINGGTAAKIFKKSYKDLDCKIITLPSTSPANTNDKEEAWYAALRTAFAST